MTTGQSTRSSRTKGPSATDHQEIEWQFDAGELEPVEGSTDGNQEDLRSVVPGSKPFRTLTKGKNWKTFEQVLESRSAADIPDKGVR